MKSPKEQIKDKIKELGREHVYGQTARICNTLNKACENEIIGICKEEALLNQVAHMQAYIELIKVDKGISQEALSTKVGDILGITQEVKTTKKSTKKTTVSKKGE